MLDFSAVVRVHQQFPDGHAGGINMFLSPG